MKKEEKSTGRAKCARIDESQIYSQGQPIKTEAVPGKRRQQRTRVDVPRLSAAGPGDPSTGEKGAVHDRAPKLSAVKNTHEVIVEYRQVRKQYNIKRANADTYGSIVAS